MISAVNRAIHAGRDRSYNSLLQTDAAINPGNSGGPLVDITGKIIGINVAIFSTSGGYQGIGFAVPSNTARAIVGDLIQGKKILYGWLGINVQDLDEELARYFGLPDNRGVVIAKVLPGGPAEKAGVKDGDVIRRYQDQPVQNVRGLLGAVARTKVGTKVTLDLIRDKKPLKVAVDVTEKPKDLSGFSERSGQAWQGLEVSELTDELIRRYRLPDRRGVVVTHVESDSPADEAGLRAGDVINEINRQPVANLNDYSQAIQNVKGDSLVRTLRGYAVIKASLVPPTGNSP
ncbi:MAG: PDZ domain-containing protein [Candidatus Omnitrophica bacterium]|nr:PDZ domain-containing protein [Candidatus Omnitrophota bacterium]